MNVVACSGFPVPVSRYWKDFSAIEISETETVVPGPGTVRRWIREAPAGFVFSVLACKAASDYEFKAKAKDVPGLTEVVNIAKQVKAKALVFYAPDLKPGRPAKTAIRAFVESLPPKTPTPVFDLPEFSTTELDATLKDTGAIGARNPLDGGAVSGKKLDLVYYRLPGPAGHRSRYEDAALEIMAAKVRATTAKLTFVTFANIDMHANGKSLAALLR